MKIKPNTLVQLSIDPKSPYGDYITYYEVELGVKNNGQDLLCLGEISNMPDHYILVSRTIPQKIVFGMHPEIFKVLDGDDLATFTTTVDIEQD